MASTARKTTAGNHGGARLGAGRKPKVKNLDGPDPYIQLARAKAKREDYRAKLNEIEYLKEAGEFYEREQILRVISTSVTVFVEQMRSLPDKLERDTGLTPHQAELVEDAIDLQLEELKFKLLAEVPDDGLR